MHTNLHGTQVVLEAAASAGVQRIVHTSTELVFVARRSKQEGAGIDETIHRTFGDMLGPYSRSKYLAEQEVANAATRGLPVIIVNPTLPIRARGLSAHAAHPHDRGFHQRQKPRLYQLRNEPD